MSYKAILIDFDGTLANSLPALWLCYKTFLKNHGHIARKNDFENLIGPTIPEIVKILKSKYRLTPTLKILNAEYKNLVKLAYLDSVNLFPNALQTLIAFKSLGFKNCIVTAAPFALVKGFLKNHEINHLIDKIISNSINEPTKPHPAIYLR